MEQKILRILEKDGRATAKEIANELCADEKEIEAIIADLEEKGIIGGYKAMVNWDKFDQNLVSALIELKVTPQIDQGFDRVAEKLAPMECITSTSTHFILKRYKEGGIVYGAEKEDSRQVIEF